jgi:hypothetical protein
MEATLARKKQLPRVAKTRARERSASVSAPVKRRSARVKSVSDSKRWNDLADTLAQLAEDICRAIEHRVAKNQELVIGAVYARGYQSFLASVRLARSGLTDDASTLIRSMVESAIAINATAKDEEFYRQLVG